MRLLEPVASLVKVVRGMITVPPHEAWVPPRRLSAAGL